MMCKISILVITAVICFTWVEANPSYKYDKNGCGPKEYFIENYEFCEPTCTDAHPLICTRLGGPRCYCVSGYLRNSNGDCIKKEKCPKRRGGDIIIPEN